MRLLYVTRSDLACPLGGRALLSALHYHCLAEICGSDLVVEKLARGPQSRAQAIRGYIDGITPRSIGAIIERIRTEQIGTVYLDGSNLGRLAAAIKAAQPHTTVLSFCHNVEARFFLGALRRNISVHALGVLLANWQAERLAVRHSDRVIALSGRDSDGLMRLYGRGATHLLPMALTDTLMDKAGGNAIIDTGAPLLFVGGAFYANRAGITWFAREVAPRVATRIRVVGQGMEAMRAKLECYPNIEVVGTVGRLEPFYREARAVIAPIFDGSGMKTKVAEALMYGKHVIGTREAFSGYESVADQAGWQCERADDFVAAIAAAEAMPIKVIDPTLRGLYERSYSQAAAIKQLGTILAGIAGR